jgi:hypothetical protein
VASSAFSTAPTRPSIVCRVLVSLGALYYNAKWAAAVVVNDPRFTDCRSAASNLTRKKLNGKSLQITSATHTSR